MDGRRSGKGSKDNSSGSEAADNQEEVAKPECDDEPEAPVEANEVGEEAGSAKKGNSEEEEEDETRTDVKGNDVNVMQLRKTSHQRSTYCVRTERRRGGRNKGRAVRRKQQLNSAGRKKSKTAPYEAGTWQDADSESSASNSPVDPPPENSGLPISEKFLYKPGVPWPDLSSYMQQLIEIRISREFITPFNKQVAQRLL